jgi:hypothetical protein
MENYYKFVGFIAVFLFLWAILAVVFAFLSSPSACQRQAELLRTQISDSQLVLIDRKLFSIEVP